MPRTIQRGLAWAAGWFTRKPTRGAPYYSLAFDRLTQDRETLAVPPYRLEGETDQARRGDRFDRLGRHTLPHGTEKNRELKEKGEASPAPLNEASASLKKNGLQGEIRQTREINPDTLAKMAGFRLKRIPIDRPRGSQGDPDPET